MNDSANKRWRGADVVNEKPNKVSKTDSTPATVVLIPTITSAQTKSIDVSFRSGETERESFESFVDNPNPLDRRRERNRLLARRTRLRSKINLEDLKKHAENLVRENEDLRSYCLEHIFPPQNAATLLDSNFDLPPGVLAVVERLIAEQVPAGGSSSCDIQQTSFCILNAVASSTPIVYTSDSFLKMFGYKRADLIGRHGMFLADPGGDIITSAKTVSNHTEISSVERALSSGTDNATVLLNYCKNGRRLLNSVQSTHLKDQTGRSFLVVSIYRTLSVDGGQSFGAAKSEQLTNFSVDTFSSENIPGQSSTVAKSIGTKFKFSPLFYNQQLQAAFNLRPLHADMKAAERLNSSGPSTGGTTLETSSGPTSDDGQDGDSVRMDGSTAVVDATEGNSEDSYHLNWNLRAFDDTDLGTWMSLDQLPKHKEMSLIDFDTSCF